MLDSIVLTTDGICDSSCVNDEYISWVELKRK